MARLAGEKVTEHDWATDDLALKLTDSNILVNPPAENDIDELSTLIKRITYYSRKFVEDQYSLENPQSNLEGLLRNGFGLDEKTIGGILVTILIRGRVDIERLTEASNASSG